MWHKVAEQPAAPPVPVRSGGLRRRPVVEVGGGYAAGGAAHLALVAARAVELERCAEARAVVRGGSGDNGRRSAAQLLSRSQGVAGFGYSLIKRMLIAPGAFGFYVGELFWPVHLAGIYPH